MKKLIFFVFVITLLFLLTGCPNVINYTPSISIPDFSVDEGDTLTLDLTQYCKDTNKNSVFSFEILSGNGEISGGTFQYAPGYTDEGIYSVSIEVSDQWGSKATDSFTITVNPVNATPTLSIPDQFVAEGATLSFDVSTYAEDLDLDSLTYELITGVGTITGTTYSYSPDNDASGTHSVTLNVCDTSDASSTNSFFVTVYDVNQVPEFGTSFEPTDEATDQSLDVTFSWNCSDPDGDSLTYDLYLGTASGNLSAATKTTETSFVTSGLDAETTYFWKVVATDAKGDSAESSEMSFTTTNAGLKFSFISAGYTHTLAIAEDGTLFAMGDNSKGQYGDGTQSSSTVPVQITGFTGAEYINTGFYHNLAIMSNNEMFSWGDNTFGQLGDTTTTLRTSPVPVFGPPSINVASGYGHSVALDINGNVFTWGLNSMYQLGDGTNAIRSVPLPVMNGVIDVASGYHHCLALKADGTVWAWGHNAYYQLGDGTVINKPIPVPVLFPPDVNIVDIAAGAYHSVALDSNGTVWTWGHNGQNQLGDGTNVSRPVPTPIIIDSSSQVVSLACGSYFTMALMADGTVYSWGDNGYGQLGNGAGSNQVYPTKINSLSNIVAISGGDKHATALESNGTAWVWGGNDYYQLGDGTNVRKGYPIKLIINAD